MRAFDRKPQQALQAAVFQAMQKGSQILASNKLCLVARDDAADALASSHNHIIYTLRVAATSSQRFEVPVPDDYSSAILPRVGVAVGAATSAPVTLATSLSSIASADATVTRAGRGAGASPIADAQSSVDMCIWPAHDELTKFTCRAPSSEYCTCHTVKLSLNHETRKGSGFCTCPNTSALLCKHIHASILFLGGFDVCGFEMDDLRQAEDLDFVFAEQEADANDDCMADPADINPDPPVSATMLDSDEEDMGDADIVFADACAKLELDIIRTMEEMLMESKLPKKQQDEVCQRVIYAATHRMRIGKTKIAPPNRPGRPFAGRGGSGPRPIPTSVASDAFRAAVKIGRPKTTGAADAPRRFPLPPLDDIHKRLGSRSPPMVGMGSSAAAVGTTALMDGVTSFAAVVAVPLSVSDRASTAQKLKRRQLAKEDAGASLQESPIKKTRQHTKH
jgi:hypothetical protein